jgi:hypothetical protein
VKGFINLIKLPEVVEVWGTEAFAQTFAAAVQQLGTADLPLQQALAQSSHVSESPRTVVVLDSGATDTRIQVRAGIFYFGVIAGSCCSDDPTPMCEENEYCEVQFDIDRHTGIARLTLMSG